MQWSKTQRAKEDSKLKKMTILNMNDLYHEDKAASMNLSLLKNELDEQRKSLILEDTDYGL